MNSICEKIDHFTKRAQIEYMKAKYSDVICQLLEGGGYIWGTGRLGKFAYQQCIQNRIKIHGYIDNNEEKWSVRDDVYAPNRLNPKDCVIIASICYVEIARQLEELGIKHYIYYEELAHLQDGISIYSLTFEKLFDEIEKNRDKYVQIYNILEDELSKKVYTEVMNYRMSLDVRYIVKAYELSIKEGCQYFDRIITSNLNKEYAFYDVGGFDGESTLDYIQHVDGYKKVFFFEPTAETLDIAKKRLDHYDNIEFIQAAVGADKGKTYINDVGGAGNYISTSGTDCVPLVKLEDCISSHLSYVKLDIEGYEAQALYGMKNAVMQYKPLLAVSVYHLPGDIHELTSLLLSWNPRYKVYMRHYTESYADTVCYFVNES